MLELRARAFTSLRNWQKGLEFYKTVFEIDPDYGDCAFQLARCAIYTKKWGVLNSAIPSIGDYAQSGISSTLSKKIETLPDHEFVEIVNYDNIITVLDNHILDRWANLDLGSRPDSIYQIDLLCLDLAIEGPYLGHILYLTYSRSVSQARIIFEQFVDLHSAYDIAIWASPSLGKYPHELRAINDWIVTEINPYAMSTKTLEALCVSEYLSPSLEGVVRKYLQHIPPEMISEAVRIIGKRTDPRKYMTEEILENMIYAGIKIDSSSQIYTWMIEHCLRSEQTNLIEKMFENNPMGIAKPITNSLQNLVRNRFDERLYNLIEVLIGQECMFEEIGMRQEIAKSILEVFDPIIAFTFAYECIQIEPQDAACGLYLMQSAILSGSPALILQAADITLSMKHRSSKIDYASIAIAAIRMNKLDYAKNLLIENRLVSDTRTQRIRVGLPFHAEKNYQVVLDEIKNTQNKHHTDPPLIFYEVLSLMRLRRYEEAIQCTQDKVRDSTEKSLLLHMIYRHSEQHEIAKITLDNLLVSQKRSVLPESFFENNYDFNSLSATAFDKGKLLGDGPLVTVIMTVHKWNNAFPLAVNSILNQSYTNFELIIVDDCSPDEDRIRYDTLLVDKRIKRIRMDENSGTYACRNRGIEISLGEYVTFADSDDWNHPDRISNSISIIEERDVDLVMGRFVRMDKQGQLQFNGSKISQFCLVGVFIRKRVIDENHLRFDGRARFSADSEFFERVSILLGSKRIYRHSGIDIFALHHDDSLTGGGANLIDWMGPGETRLRYVSGYRRTHKKLEINNEFEFNDFPSPSSELITNTPNKLDSKLRSLLGLQRNEEIFVETKSSSDEISVFMATYPGGFKTVSDALNSILNQTKKVDRIILHVNSNKPPENLPNDSRIEVRLSESNDADNGKFKYMNEFNGYFLTVDDDISYPTDYVEKMLSYVDRFDRQSIIGVHGAVFPVGPPLTRWSEYRELRRTHTFTTANSSFTQVNCLGTGTIAFHSQIGTPNFERFDTLRMVDLHIAVWAHENNIPMYSCPRSKNWLTEFEIEHQTRIWAQANNERELQAQMIQTLNKIQHWKKLHILGLEMLNGPLSKFEGWENRQIPMGMKLPDHIEWKEIPDTPKVTIYIPAFNTAEYIVECVNSALMQTYQNIEISIQNGGDADDTYAKLMEHYSSHENIIISSQLTTLGEGTNIAIAQGSGELILQLDSDDILHPRAVELLVNAIGKTNVCAYGNFSRIDKDGNTIDSGWEEPLYSRERLTRSMIIHHPRLFRRDAWELVGGHNEDLRNAEDYDFFLKLSEVGNIVHLRETLYSYRILEGSASNFSSEVLTKNTHYVQNKMIERNQLRYDLVIPNQNQPRNVLYRHVVYSSLEIKPLS